MKLIKINTNHYIIVDDSEIKEGDWYYWEITKTIQIAKLDSLNRLPKNSDGSKKITHSTQPLKKEKITNPTTQIVREAMKIVSKDVIAPKVVRNGLVKPTITLLSLQEVKELLGEVDIWQKFKEIDGSCQKGGYEHWLFESGYNQALEDNKEKKYTEEDLKRAFFNGGNMKEIEEFNYFIKSLQPKTEWQVEFIDGKLKLK